MSDHSEEMENSYAKEFDNRSTEEDFHEIMLNVLDCDSVSECLAVNTYREAVSLDALRIR